MLFVSFWMERRCLEPKALKVKLHLPDTGAVVDQRTSLRDHSSVSSAGSSRKKRKAVVRKESADTQEYDPCQQNDMDVDMVENKEELRFVQKCSKRFSWMARNKVQVPQSMLEGGFEDLRRSVDNCGRRRGAAHDKSLPELLQFNARRKKGTSDDRQAMEDPS